jgi:phage protein D
MPSDEVAFLRVKIETADVGEQVWSLDLEDVDRGSDKVTLIMDDPDSTSSDALQEGEFVRVELGWETEYALAFEGIVRQVRSVAQGTSRVEVVAYDLSTRLTMGSRPLSRQHEGTLEEILAAILERHSIPMGSVQIDPMPSWPDAGGEPLLQQNKNDWEFIQDLAEEYRARAFVEVNAAEDDSDAVRERGGCSRFYFVSEQVLLDQDPMGRLLYCPGMGRLLEFDYTRVASGASPSASLTVSNPDTGEPEARVGEEPAPGPVPEASAERSSRVETTHGEVRARTYEGGVEVAAAAETQPEALRARDTIPGLPSSPELAERRIQQDRTRILGFHGRGVAMGTVSLRAKGPVEIEGLASWAQGRWYISRVNHVLQRTRIGSDTQLTFRSRFVATR